MSARWRKSSSRGSLARAYTQLGPRYPRAALVVTFHVQHVVMVASVAGLALFVPSSLGKYLLLVLAAVVAQEIYGFFALRYFRSRLEPVVRWIETHNSVSAADAWRAAASVPLELLRQWVRGGYPFLTILGWSLFATWLLRLPAYAITILFAATIVATTYGNALGFFLMERAMRPVLDDIAGRMSDEADPHASSLPLGRRLLAALPALNVITGVVVVGVSVLLASSVVSPIDRLTAATARVSRGELETRVPVVASDETGELTRGFNRMLSGLQERERLRDAFGTFVDPELAERVAREGTDLRGEELDVSILFMDVRGFTAYAERAPATDVVARLNELYDVVVPIILEHGGHANKFIGDGLLAVFGAPEKLADHADRAVRAGLEIAARVRQRYSGDLRVGVGVNSGTVVVGTIGGGGRLDFTVIGDAVNTASRVESATRTTDDDVLITADTRLGAATSNPTQGQDRCHRALRALG